MKDVARPPGLAANGKAIASSSAPRAGHSEKTNLASCHRHRHRDIIRNIMKTVSSFWNAIRDTFVVSHVHVHAPSEALVVSNPDDGCSRRIVAKVATGNALLASGRYVTRAQMDDRYDRIMSFDAS